MTRTRRPLAAAVVLLTLALPFLGSSVPVSAHEHRHVGPYELTVGWREEPPVVGVLNGLDLGIHWEANGTPVEGVAADLTATLTFGTSSISPLLGPQFGRPGWYTFEVIPTRSGVYSMRIQGDLDGTPVDETVELQEVSPRSDIEFPDPDPTPGGLADELSAARAELATLQGQITVLIAVASLGLVLAAISTAASLRLGRRLRPPS